MVNKNTGYYGLNKVLLLAIGLWPYQQSKLTQLQFIFFSTILSAAIIFQLTPLVTLKCTSDVITKVLSSVSFFVARTIEYNSFYVNIEVMKKLLTELQHILNNLKDKNEIAIVKKYSCIAKRYTITLTVLAVCGSFTCIIIQFWSKLMSAIDSEILIAIVPINISQPYLFPIMIEYFVDQEKYFYLIILHIYATLFIGGIITLGTGTILITYIQYTCGMFRIASYRLEHAMRFNILQSITLKNEILMTNGIIYAVNVHRQAMKLTKNLISVLNMLMCWIIVNNIICISINLFCIASSGYNVMELSFPFIFLLVHVLYMFISNYIGQNIIDHNNYIFSTAYKVQWYRAPIHIQKMILFLLQRETKEFTLTVGGLFTASMEGFAMLIKASVSYFTVIYSTQ